MDANHSLRILMVEDVPSDAELAERELRNSGFQFTSLRVDTKEGFLKALEEFQPHLIISDYAMPEFDGMQALMLSLERDAKLPFIVLTGSMNEETAVDCMKAGATNYVIKDRLARLPFAVREALEKKKHLLEKEAAEQELLKSEEKYRLLIDSANEAIFVLQDGKMAFLNPMTVRISGYSSEELMARPFTEFVHPDDRDMALDRHIKRMKGGEIPHVYSFRIIHKDGSIRWVELNAVLINWNGKAATLNFLSDITERKRAEEALRVSEESFKSYLEYAPDGVYMSDLEGTFLYGNRKCEAIIGYKREELIGKNFLELNLLSEKSLNKAAQLLQANIEGKSTGPDEIELIGKEGRIIPVEINTSAIQRVGQRIVLAFVRDITDRKQAEEKLKNTLESLRKAFIASIQLMVSAVEARDPYTSGHQIRSTNLARSIATEMGLSRDKIEGIRMAGSIHDIGKLSIPAEILSKPTKLSELEFSLIKEHPRKGYEMLKDVESPWPLAQIVYQHHERMDGSGYPRNLKGDEILIEARIMAVADVVESMASHRPYRPALGIDAALNEIEKNRGTHYDNAVADACLKLFREKGFKLEGT